MSEDKLSDKEFEQALLLRKLEFEVRDLESRWRASGRAMKVMLQAIAVLGGISTVVALVVSIGDPLPASRVDRCATEGRPDVRQIARGHDKHVATSDGLSQQGQKSGKLRVAGRIAAAHDKIHERPGQDRYH